MIFDADAMAELIAEKVARRLEESLGDDVLTTEEAARLLKLHPVTVSDMAAKGVLPARKLGRDWRFRRSALLAHITDTAREGVRQFPLAGD